MNWRNPFLITYLSVTVVGAAILGYFAYSAWTNAQEVDTNYVSAVGRLQGLQNQRPFPSDQNNEKFVQLTKEYRAAYDQLVAKASSMQKAVESITPQDFQDRLRADVSAVVQAAKENNVLLPEGFYLGFDRYQSVVPSEAAAGPLAQELAAIRLVVDQLIQLKVKSIDGLTRDLLPSEGGRQATAQPAPGTHQGNRPQGGGNNRPGTRQGNNSPQPARDVVVANSFDIVFVADQNAARAALNFIANSDQFFIIRNVNIENSAMEGPLRDLAAQAPPPPDPAQPGAPTETPAVAGVNVLVGLEALKVALRVEMITFNNLPGAK